MVRSNNIDELIITFMEGKEGLTKFGLDDFMHKRKAGIWQGINAYQDMNMFILRDVNYEHDIPEEIGELVNMTLPDFEWAEKHFQERISGIPSNPGEAYKTWPYAKFKENDDEFLKGKQFDHSYMERFWPKGAGEAKSIKIPEHLDDGKTKLFTSYPHVGIRFDYGDYNDVLTQLKEQPLTRQAFLPIFFPEDTGAKNNIRVPCTLGYLFEIFDNKLDITYYIRSCDIYRHFRNDIYMAGRLLQHTKKILFKYGNKDLQTGKLSMKIANLHLFENDIYPLIKREKSNKTSL